MRRWYVGFNNYWFISNIFLEEMPVILCFLEWLSGIICYFIPSIKLPKIKFKLKDKEDWDFTDKGDGWTDLRAWYGDLNQLWHAFICISVSNLINKYSKIKTINLPFNFAKEEFPNEYIDTDDDDDLEDVNINRNRKISNQLDKEFKDVYYKLNYDYLRKRRN